MERDCFPCFPFFLLKVLFCEIMLHASHLTAVRKKAKKVIDTDTSPDSDELAINPETTYLQTAC